MKKQIALQEICFDKFDEVLFWGRIRGEKYFYYIAQAIVFNDQFEFPAKKFFYCTNKDFIFHELPPIITQFKEKVEEFNVQFIGDPEHKLWEEKLEEVEEEKQEEEQEQQNNEIDEDNLDVSITDSEQEALKNQVKITVFKEIDRLAYVIRAIEIECACLPIGSLKMQQNHELHYNPNFKGLSLNEAMSKENWMHFRQPLFQETKIKIEQPDAVYEKNLLDGIMNDQPRNIWSIKHDVSEEIVTLRNYMWPGYLSYLWVDQNRYGYCYFGEGIKNVEISLYLQIIQNGNQLTAQFFDIIIFLYKFSFLKTKNCQKISQQQCQYNITIASHHQQH